MAISKLIPMGEMKKASTTLPTLSQTLDLYQVEAFMPAIQDSKTLPAEIDVSEITKYTTAGLQLLLSIAKSAAEAKQVFSVDLTAQAAAHALEALGLQPSDFTNGE